MSRGASGLANRVRSNWRRKEPYAITALVGAIVFGVALSAVTLVDRVGRPDADGRPGVVGGQTVVGVPPAPAAGRPEGSIPGIRVHVDERAGYLVSFPSAWRLDGAGRRDRLTDPTGTSVISFGQAPPGPLPDAAQAVMQDLAPPDARVAIVSRTVERTEQGQRGLVIGATATDADGGAVQIVAIAIRGATQNYAITARFPPAVPEGFVDDIEQIIGSFRTSGP